MNHPIMKTSPADAKLRRVSAYVAAIFFGGLFGLVLTFFVVSLRGRGSIPEISAADVEVARQKWNRAAVMNYDVTVLVRSRELSTYRVSVRDGTVQEASRNDQPLRQQRTLGTWSVQGMFETIEYDLRTLELHRAGDAQPGTPQLSLRGRFDDSFGFPIRYQRTEMRKFGSNSEVSWEVVEFKRLK
jgi:hypothetical protein